eukprot:NODE_6693_length_855_cov_20.765027_g6095_i0.p1 GENE.NODE_6693_length_855_cov_20.765027_g6095_i0~~NODE_6693_length_855_cov_20.765027_g6095_i0.p1  ORF type:complete len:220 (-),score=37.20 NODE_6693_length_855_cov_20.765027_g6095_i0:196-813(-)
MAEKPGDLMKIIVIGESGVGKTNLITRYTLDEFSVDSPSTIGVEFLDKTVRIQDQDVKLSIWDTAGQERFRAMAKSIYRGAHGFVVVYDVTNAVSFSYLQTWIKEAREYGHPDAQFVLVGNKIDLDPKEVTTDEGKEFANTNGLLFTEASALTGNGVDGIFDSLSQSIYKRRSSSPPPAPPPEPIKLNPIINKNTGNSSGKKCCN